VDGIALVRQIGDSFPHVPCVVASRCDDPKQVVEALRSGASAYLAGVHTSEAIVATLQQVLAGAAPRLQLDVEQQVRKRLYELNDSDDASTLAESDLRFDRGMEALRRLPGQVRADMDPNTAWIRLVRGAIAIGHPGERSARVPLLTCAGDMLDHPAAAFLERFGCLFGGVGDLSTIHYLGATALNEGQWHRFTLNASDDPIDVVVDTSGRVVHSCCPAVSQLPPRAMLC